LTRFVPRICAECQKPGGTIAFRYKRTMNGKLTSVRDYFHPRCLRKLTARLDGAKT
jgi:hypothetical protein